MNKIIILGGEGMLGHKAYQVFSEEFDTYLTFYNFEAVKKLNIFNNGKIYDKIDAFQLKLIEDIIVDIKPKVVINCIGVIKQRNESNNPKIMIYLNSLLPHLLNEICCKFNSRLIHVSTDCVFSGISGNYSESDIPDARDLYGMTKYLGEVKDNSFLTIRTSIIGHELLSNLALVDWFLSNKGKVVLGYKNVIYTGLPTVILCKEIKRIIMEYPDLKGLYHVSSEKISKYDLLMKINEIYKLEIEIREETDTFNDKSLNSDLYRKKTSFVLLNWDEMVNIMHADYVKNYCYKWK